MKALKLLFVVLLITSGLVLGISYLLSSPRFRISVIMVSGNHEVSLQEISDLMTVPKGENIFKFNSSRIIKILELHPWIKKAAIKRKLPNKILLTLDERKPIALLRLAPQEGYLLDREGFVIDKAGTADSGNLIKIMPHGLNIAPKEGNKLIDPVLKEILNLAYVFRRVSPWEGKELEQIEWHKELGTILKFKNLSTEFRLGKDHYQEKLIKSRLITEYLEPNKAIVYMDLNYDDKVIVKYY